MQQYDTSSLDCNLSQAIESAVENAMAKAMDKLISNLSDCSMQILSTQMMQGVQAQAPTVPQQSDTIDATELHSMVLDELSECVHNAEQPVPQVQPDRCAP